MLRTFQTSTIRDIRELSNQYWDFDCQGHERMKVFVPSCWETYPGFESYRGTAEYRTEFEAEGNARLVFKGVSFMANVRVDGREVGRHEDAYTPFEIVLTGLDAGVHTLCVTVSNAFSESSALHVPNDYMSWGGITRGVAVERIGCAYLRYVHVTPFIRDGVWHASVQAKAVNLSNTVMNAMVYADIAGIQVALKGEPIPAGGMSLFVGEAAFPGAQTYEPHHPNLYEVHTTLKADGEVIDDLIDRFGFRTVCVEGEKILFNGRPLHIRGFNRHESHGLFGGALPAAAHAQDIALMKDLHANAVRTCHYPNDEVFLDLCDEQGLLVWEESHARGLDIVRMRNPNFLRQSLQSIREMIEAHWNHPSIFIWGCLNECWSDTDYGRECYQRLIGEIRLLDSSRPVTTASCRLASEVLGNGQATPYPRTPVMDGEVFHDGDICLDLPDVVSFNIYPLWYVDLPPAEHIGRLWHWIQKTGGAGKPFLISEAGAGAVYGFRSRTRDKWSEEYQCDLMEELLRCAFADEHVQGVFLWQFADCRVSREFFNNRPRTMNNKGVVDEYRRPKLAYDTVQKLFMREENKR